MVTGTMAKPDADAADIPQDKGNPHSNTNSNSNGTQNNNNSASTSRPPEGEEYVATPQLSNNHNNNNNCNATTNEAHLAEVLVVVNDTKIEAPPVSCELNATPLDSNANEGMSVTSGGRPFAPIACEEEEASDCESKSSTSCGLEKCFEINEKPGVPPNEVEHGCNVRRSKSRVRTYLKKCKDRLTGHHHHIAAATHPNVVAIDVEQQLPIVEELHEPQATEDSLSTLGAVEEDDGSYEDIDFSLTTVAVITANNESTSAENGVGLLAEIEAQQAEMQRECQVKEEQLRRTLQMESGLAELIDRHLSHIYPVYFECTRAVLIRQARDLLVCSYHGCLLSFEQKFLCKFAEIAEDLRQKHAIGESLIWCQGWPLATPTGELILHLGALDDAQLRPAEIYLCVKTVESFDAPPQLHAVWRSAQRVEATTVQSRCIDHSDPKAYLSILTLEMLSDELPQLLQNLLVGVERTIGRLTLNELQMPKVGEQQQQQQQQQQYLTADESNIGNNQNHNNNNNNGITNSPKCALKRSELITKNKMLSNKYMLRRLTNRQDSMNSTSSGNSCASSGSASSDELLYCHHNMTAAAMHTQSNTSTSPALPLFCLGNSFPHIDSDEENSDEKRNSMEGDQFETEIIPPSSITEIPEKLLTTGIYLPGTRDLKGQPIVTVDAESVAAAGLNCYEVATVLLYYSTIPESHSNGNNSNVHSNPQSLGESLRQSTAITNSATTTTTVKPAQQTFTILIAIEKSHHLCVIDLICQSLKLLTRHIAYCEILAVCHDCTLLQLCKNSATAKTTTTTSPTKTTSSVAAAINNNECDKQQQQQHLVKFISVDEVTTSVAASQIPHGKLCGLHHHDARKWREFFTQLEPFQRQCSAAGQRLVTAMSDIRSADLQGLPTRRQLYAQHRALSRALMDSELHNLRKRGATTLTRLQELAKNLNSSHSSSNSNSNNCNNIKNSSNSNNKSLSTASAVAINSYNNNNNNHISQHHSSTKSTVVTSVDVSTTSTASRLNIIGHDNGSSSSSSNNIDVAIRLHKVSLLFNEVDRSAKRLEQLTEQRRERLRELTRQRALEDEINEVTSWITSDGNDALQRFANLQLDCETAIKEHELEFEKYYFISMKHLAKGRDLHDAAASMDALRESAINLKSALDCFAEKLEQARERIEGASRLHHLLSLHIREQSMEQEMKRLAEKIGVPGLLEKYQQQQLQQEHETETGIGSLQRIKPNSLNLNCNRSISSKSSQALLYTSTPAQKPNRSSHRSSSGNGSFEGQTCHCWRESRNLEDMDELMDADEEDAEEEQSKIADSGVGGCDRCEGNPKLTRICSCQSLNEAGNLYDKGNDELDDECFERPSKHYLDIHSPIEANSHLQCHASNFELPKMEELSCLDPKIQKTLLLIMREMIGTERDYVRSLYYVIENYVDELLRDDIPQPLRGQRNVIFGNIEKIFEFHNSHFLSELERYERNPLKVGAAFLEMESKFYLYALYNKNKPKSDTLMSEYGTAFFKSKQFELTDKMDLASYLLKPVQRMGKYALLLQQLVKACSTVEGSALQEISADVEELQRAEEMVKFQLRHGNDLLAMDSLRDCDVNVKEQGRLLRQNEFLVWQGRGGKKTLRQVFLFEELVLFSKARRFPDHKNLDIYIYKNSIKTSDIGLTAHTGDSPTKFEIWFRKRKPDDTWTLQCMNEDIKNAWTEEFSKLLWKQAKRNREIRLAEMSSMGIGSKPCLDIRPSNHQISNRSITITQLGKTPKLRHSFVGLHAEQGKSTRRPNSLISESSLSSGTSSSSLSTGSSSGHERLSGLSKSASNNHALELINETQALMLSSGGNNHNNNGHNSSSNSNTLSSSSSGLSASASGNMRNHKRSTTLVSQLSMESGILSDISMTPDQEQPDATASWSAASTPTGPPPAITTTTTTTVIMRRHKAHKSENQKEGMEIMNEGNPYLKDKEGLTVNL